MEERQERRGTDLRDAPVSCTTDANVFVASSRFSEQGHAQSLKFLDEAIARELVLPCPVLVLPESVAAVARATGDIAKATRLLSDIRRHPALRLVPVDDSLASRAAEIAMTCRLRGADSIYVAVAEANSATLITWDLEMLARAPAVVPTMTPADWLAQHPATP